MRRRSLLAGLAGGLVGSAGCSSPTARRTDSDDRRVDGEDERSLERPTDDPIATDRIGDPADGVDPHVVTVRNAGPNRDLEVRVLAGDPGDPGDLVRSERYAVATGEHVRLELREPAAYAIELRDGGDPVGEPFEIEADWFDYDCPTTVVELGEGDRITASTTPDTDACA